jgi:hypothetical protein
MLASPLSFRVIQQMTKTQKPRLGLPTGAFLAAGNPWGVPVGATLSVGHGHTLAKPIAKIDASIRWGDYDMACKRGHDHRLFPWVERMRNGAAFYVYALLNLINRVNHLINGLNRACLTGS